MSVIYRHLAARPRLPATHSSPQLIVDHSTPMVTDADHVAVQDVRALWQDTTGLVGV